MKKISILLLNLMLWMSPFLGGCNGKIGGTGDGIAGDSINYYEEVQKMELDLGKNKAYLVTITTDLGEMKLVLHNETPLHRDNFVKLTKLGFFDNLAFHRIIEGFMIQGGDPDSRDAEPDVRLGNGGPGYTIPAEFDSTLFHKKGALAAARKGDQVNPSKASSGSQFYIVQGTVFESKQALLQANINWQQVNRYLQQLFQDPEYQQVSEEIQLMANDTDQTRMMNRIFELIPTLEEKYEVSLMPGMREENMEAYTTVGGAPNLDMGYTVFGQLVDGFDVLDKIAGVPTNKQLGDRPIEDVTFSVEVDEVSKKKISKQFDYTFPE